MRVSRFTPARAMPETWHGLQRLAMWRSSVSFGTTFSNDGLIEMSTVAASPKFQINIPLDVCRRIQIQPGAQLTVVELNGTLRLFPITSPSSLRGISRGVDARIEREADRAL